MNSIANITLSNFYHQLLQKTMNAADLESLSFPGLAPGFPVNPEHSIYRGKVRDLIIDDHCIYMIHSDRLSAFDRSIGLVPYKGLILAAISAFWFKMLDGIVPHHFLAAPHPRIIQAKKLRPLKVEVVVRGYLAGSMQRAYQSGVRDFCGNLLPEGLEAFAKLPNPIITPTTKADVYEHDAEISAAQLLANAIVTEKQWDKIKEYALKVFAIGQKEFATRGWTLVDTKYEFGVDDADCVHLIDEVHTPDSSRLWRNIQRESADGTAKTPEMFDKEIVRRYLQDQGFTGYGPVPNVPAALFIEMAQRYLTVADHLLAKPLRIDANCNVLPEF